MGNETKEITEELFDSLLQKYQNGLDKKNERKWICFWQGWSIVL